MYTAFSLFSMATYSCQQVISMIDDNSTWSNSEDDDLSDFEDYASQSNPLDNAQVDTDTPGVITSGIISTEDESMINESPTHSPSNSQSNSQGTSTSSTAVAFSPLPFTAETGPRTILDSDATPLDFFMLLFDDIFKLIVDQTNLYASQYPPSDRYPWVDTCISEIKLFLGIIIAMGLHQLPQVEDYWSSDILLKAPGIVDGMPINRFKQLLSCFHLNDNSKMKARDHPEFDKLHKVRPLLTMARDNFLREYRPSRELSVDEAMVGFKGRSSLKQYMPLKPTKRGYKVWCLCDANNGYMCNFDVYTGAGTAVHESGGLGPSVVLKLTAPFKGLGHFVFYDNFFSTVNLACTLLEHYNTYSCGTARSNRKKFPSGLKNIKLDRGESRSAVVENSNVNCIVWQDKKLVYFIDTISDPTKITQVLRRNKDGSQAVVDCPLAVKSYNAGMGGVDLADAKRKVYTCSRKSKKWWPRLFYFILDVCIVNAYVLQCETPHQQKLSQKSFRLELARELLASHNSRKHRKRGRSTTDGSPSIIFTERHFPDKLPSPLQCRLCSKSRERRRTSYCCKDCSDTEPVPLCVVPCFRIYHTK